MIMENYLRCSSKCSEAVIPVMAAFKNKTYKFLSFPETSHLIWTELNKLYDVLITIVSHAKIMGLIC